MPRGHPSRGASINLRSWICGPGFADDKILVVLNYSGMGPGQQQQLDRHVAVLDSAIPPEEERVRHHASVHVAAAAAAAEGDAELLGADYQMGPGQQQQLDRHHAAPDADAELLGDGADHKIGPGQQQQFDRHHLRSHQNASVAVEIAPCVRRAWRHGHDHDVYLWIDHHIHCHLSHHGSHNAWRHGNDHDVYLWIDHHIHCHLCHHGHGHRHDRFCSFLHVVY